MCLLTQLCFWCQVQLHPHHLPLLAHLKSCLDDSADSSAAAAAAKEAALQALAAAGQAPAARSIIEGMLLPDTTAFATEFMTKSWAYGQGDPPGSAEEVKTLLTHSWNCVPGIGFASAVTPEAISARLQSSSGQS